MKCSVYIHLQNKFIQYCALAQSLSYMQHKWLTIILPSHYIIMRTLKYVLKLNYLSAMISTHSLSGSVDMAVSLFKQLQTVWDYHLVNQEIRKSDAIFVLCSYDLRVAEHAAQLYLDGYAPLLIFSGAQGRATEGLFTLSEAETFANVAKDMGVPSSAIIVETKATNTGENIFFTQALLKEKNISISSLLLVQKPYMERRLLATFLKNWNDIEFCISSPNISFINYPTDEITFDHIASIILGELHRLKVYPTLGYQEAQEIPDEVWQAFENLTQLGFDEYLLTNDN